MSGTSDAAGSAAAASGTVAPGVPEGFKPIHSMGGFIQVNGPLHYRMHDGRFQLGFRVEDRHANPMGICHGGWMASFCDMLLPMAAHRDPAVGLKFLPTINLQIDYLATAPVGAWVQGEGQVLRATRSLVFVQGLVAADGKPVARASGIFKIGPELKRVRPAPAAEG